MSVVMRCGCVGGIGDCCGVGDVRMAILPDTGASGVGEQCTINSDDHLKELSYS